MCGKFLQLIVLLFCFLFNTTEVYSQLRQNDKEVIYSGPYNKIRFNNPHDTLGVKYGNEVYFTRWIVVNTDNAGIGGEKRIMDTNIYVFDLNKGETEILKPLNDPDNEYVRKGALMNLLLDKAGGRLFFTSAEQQKNLGLDGSVTWYYDLKTKQQNIFKEGSITEISSKGIVSVQTNGSDYKGSYTQLIKYNSKGMGIEFGQRIYNKK